MLTTLRVLVLTLTLAFNLIGCASTQSFWAKQASYTPGPSWTPGADLESGGKAIVAIGCHLGMADQPAQWGFAWTQAEMDCTVRANELFKRAVKSETKVDKGYTHSDKSGLNSHTSVSRKTGTQSQATISFPENIGRAVFDDGMFCVKMKFPVKNIKSR